MNRDNVYAFPGGSLPPDQVLRKVVIGWTKAPQDDGRRFYVASSYGTDEAVIYAIQHANQLVLRCTTES